MHTSVKTISNARMKNLQKWNAELNDLIYVGAKLVRAEIGVPWTESQNLDEK